MPRKTIRKGTAADVWRVARTTMCCAIGAIVAFQGYAHSLAAGEDVETESVEAQFLAPANGYSLGEPVWVEFVARNASDAQVRFIIGRGRHNSFRFTATDSEGRPVKELDPYSPTGGWAPVVRIGSGETFRERIILNKYLAIEEPGAYSVSCELDVDLLREDENALRPVDGGRIRVSGRLEIEIGAFDEETVTATAERLALLLENEDGEIRAGAAEALGYVRGAIAKPHLLAALDNVDPVVRAWAVRDLSRPGDENAVEAVLLGLKAKDATTRLEVAAALGRIGLGDEKALGGLYELLGDSNARVRRAAVEGVARIGDEEDLPRIQGMADDPDADVRSAVVRTIETLRSRESESD